MITQRTHTHAGRHMLSLSLSFLVSLSLCLCLSVCALLASLYPLIFAFCPLYSLSLSLFQGVSHTLPPFLTLHYYIGC